MEWEDGRLTRGIYFGHFDITPYPPKNWLLMIACAKSTHNLSLYAKLVLLSQVRNNTGLHHYIVFSSVAWSSGTTTVRCNVNEPKLQIQIHLYVFLLSWWMKPEPKGIFNSKLSGQKNVFSLPLFCPQVFKIPLTKL